jgi:polyisoprenyl-phosphate glycosyltransferase
VKKTISIVTPCYNEVAGIQKCYDTVQEIARKELAEYRIEHIFCDNASSDGTIDILRDIAAKDPNVKVILNARNFGPMRSHFNGVKNASGDATLLFLPADLQDPPELLPEFVKLWEQGYEVIYGIRADREEGFSMRMTRKLYYRLISGSTYLDMPPDVGDFQLVDRKVLDAIKTFDDTYPFVRAMTFEVGFRKVGVPYTSRARETGVSKNRLFHLIDQGLNGLISFSSVPIRLALGVGVLLSFLSIGFAIVNAVLYLTGSVSDVPRGTTLIITALFFFAGVQLFFMGFIGEYILSIFNQVRNRPLVVERERINFVDDADTSSRTQ